MDIFFQSAPGWQESFKSAYGKANIKNGIDYL